ncbi:hypothetical protein TYRP_022089 [Tyrophagus putrescentiae]|nr:hypothetical protein TYRP_022089 [Tyrophagus putrescentiae]
MRFPTIPNLQKVLIGAFDRLNNSNKNSSLAAVSSHQIKQSKKSNTFLHWSTFLQLNGQWTFLCRCVEEYSRYCGALLGVILPFFIVVQCYMLTVMAFVSGSIGPVQAAIAYITALSCNLFLFALTRECAALVSCNGAFERLSRR